MQPIQIKKLTHPQNPLLRGALWGLLGLGIFAVAGIPTSWAQGAELTVKLQKLEKLQPTEKAVDELYFSITEFPAQGKASHYQIPSFPAHWLSSHLANVKDVMLWQKTLQKCEPTEVLISLVEEDLPPWNPNDLLGSVQLKISCDNGKLVQSWSIPNPEITSQVNHDTVYSFEGEKMKYQATFKFENNKVKQTIPAPVPALQKTR